MEFNALVEIILRGLYNLKVATLQNIAEFHGGGLTAFYLNGLRFLILISFLSDLSYGICADLEVINLKFALCVGGNCLAVIISARDLKLNALDLSVVGGLDDFERACRGLNSEIRCLGFGIGLNARYNVLLCRAAASDKGCRDIGHFLRCAEYKSVGDCLRRCQSNAVTRNGNRHIACLFEGVVG